MRKFFRREPELPTPTLEHPQLGRIRYEGDWWTGHKVVADYTIEFNVDGTEDGPDPQLVKDLELVLANFSSLWQEGKRLIKQELHKYGLKELDAFAPNTICNFFRKGNASYFMMCLSLEGDEYRAWRLEFFDNKAKYFGCDT